MNTQNQDDLTTLRVDAANPLAAPLHVELPPDPAEARAQELRSGDVCPRCREARMDYDGLLNLACPACGYARGGCFT